MLSVNNYSIKQNPNSFKSNTAAAPQQNPVQTNSFKTNAGLKTATGYAAFGTVLLLNANRIIRAIDKIGEKNFPEQFKTKTPKIKTAIVLPLFLVTTFACGAIVNKKINDKNAKLAADLKVKDKDKIMLEDKSVQKTEKGNLYYKSKIGDKIGPMLALGVMVINTVVNAVVNKRAPKLSFHSVIDSLAVALGGGWLLGTITDKMANKEAIAHADKPAKK